MEIFKNRYLKLLNKWIEEGIGEISVTGLSGSARAYFFSEILIELEKPCLVILPQAKEAARFFRELAFFLPEKCVSGNR